MASLQAELSSLTNRAAGQLAEMVREIEAQARTPVSPHHYVQLAARATSTRYTVLDGEQVAHQAALARISPALAQRYNRALVAHCVAEFNLDDARCVYPDSVIALYPGHLRRMLEQLDSMPAEFFDLRDDRFIKDLAILTHRLVPVGAELAQLDSGIPMRVLLGGGPRQLLRGVWFWAVRARGLKPFVALHTHLLCLDDFNPDGWDACYARLAELLELNPAFKGWLSASWFLDPKLETISPHLVYLRKVPQDNGAEVFFVDHDRKGQLGALVKSATRRRLFERGEYVPAVYMRAWPRDAVRRWHRRYRAARAATACDAPASDPAAMPRVTMERAW